MGVGVEGLGLLAGFLNGTVLVPGFELGLLGLVAGLLGTPPPFPPLP